MGELEYIFGKDGIRTDNVSVLCLPSWPSAFSIVEVIDEMLLWQGFEVRSTTEESTRSFDKSPLN